MGRGWWRTIQGVLDWVSLALAPRDGAGADLYSLSKEVFDTERGLWLVNDQNQLYPNPHEYATEGKLGAQRKEG